MVPRHLFAAIAIAGSLGAVTAADAGPAGSRQEASLTLIQTAPARSSGLKLQIDYVNPADPSAKPPPVRRVATRLRLGARYDTAVPGQCEASDAELMAQGESACPTDSRVGSGFLRIDTGVAGPGRFVEADIVFLNRADQLIFLSIVRGSGAIVVTRSRIAQNVIVSKAPVLPGTPPDGGSIDVVRVRLKAVNRTIDGERRGYVTTPPRCPPSGEWINRVRFAYADAVTQVTTNPSPCSG